MSKKRSMLFKVLMEGEEKVGKTSLIQQYCLSKFSKAYKPTMMADFANKNVQCGD